MIKGFYCLVYFEQKCCHDFNFLLILFQQNFCHLSWLVMSDHFFPFSDNLWLCLVPVLLPALSTAAMPQGFYFSWIIRHLCALESISFKLGYRLIAGCYCSQAMSDFPLWPWVVLGTWGKRVGNGKSGWFFKQDKREAQLAYFKGWPCNFIAR